jgi:isoleucyl-tRNA synthetase
MVAKM